jgi:hypothetical protein
MGTREQIEETILKNAKEDDIKTKQIHSYMTNCNMVYEAEQLEINKERHLRYNVDRIKKIDKVPVDVYIDIGYDSIELEIESDMICFEGWSKKYFNKMFYTPKIDPNGNHMTPRKPVNSDIIFETIVKILNILPLLKFDKYTGHFTTHHHDTPCYDLFAADNIELRQDGECVVCYERTKTKTPCLHYLCFACNENIPTKEEDDRRVRDCPICRQDILFYDNNDNSDDDN